MAALLDEAVPDPRDRIDFAALDRPLDGVRAGSLDDAAAAGARAHRRGPAPARRPRAHPAPRRVRGDAVGVRAGHTAGHRGRADRPLEGPRHPVVAELLQRGRQRAARLPGPAAAGAVPRRVRAVPRAGDVDRGRRRPVPGGRVGRARRDRDGDRDGRRAAAGAQRLAYRGPAARRAAAPRRGRRGGPRRRRRHRAAQHRRDPRPPGGRRAGRRAGPGARRGGSRSARTPTCAWPARSPGRGRTRRACATTTPWPAPCSAACRPRRGPHQRPRNGLPPRSSAGRWWARPPPPPAPRAPPWRSRAPPTRSRCPRRTRRRWRASCRRPRVPAGSSGYW